MKIYKFGGASVKDADGIRNVAKIISESDDKTVVVVSAIGKTTNALELLVKAFFEGDRVEQKRILTNIASNHLQIATELMGQNNTTCHTLLQSFLAKLDDKLQTPPSLNYNFEYDQIICFGEIMSTCIVSSYLNHISKECKWVDIRSCLKTDDTYRDAKIDWDLSEKFVSQTFSDEYDLYVTQGFIGSTINNLTTTLGREGSDYSAAIIAHILNAQSVTIWKDVPGVMSADPRWYHNATFLPQLSYWEAIELTYCGANVIHPKTLKPLQNKSIPLHVRSFIQPAECGTTISELDTNNSLPPLLILKRNQMFISMSPKDFSFIMEDNLSHIFSMFSKHHIKINLLQNSALNFSVCIDKTDGVEPLLAELGEFYNTRYNDNLELLNVRHYTAETLQNITRGKDIIDSQITRKSARYVLKTSEWNF